LKTAALGAAAVILPRPLFAGEEPRTEAFQIVQLCDTQLGFGGYDRSVRAFKQAVKHINAIKPDLVFICGDLVNTPDKKPIADFTEIKAEIRVPCHCACGNHDVGNTPTAESLQRYRKVIGSDYYSFKHRGCVFVVANTQLWKAAVKDESEKHDAWFAATLQSAEKKKARIFVVGHYPLFVEDQDEADGYYNLPVAKRKELLSIFEKRGVVAVLGGHTHRLRTNEHKGIQLVNGETTSLNFDKRPLGFRVWHIADTRPFKHEHVALEGIKEVGSSHRTIDHATT
jgi:predicted phosphodiesterase